MAQQFKRKAALIIQRPQEGRLDNSSYVPESNIDLSEMHFTFNTKQIDDEGPSNCSIRVFNLKKDTVETIKKYGYSEVILNAGYEGQYGVIFKGTIKQFRTGKVNATDTYLDILAADGDIGYNFGFMSQTFAAGSTSKQRVDAIVGTLNEYGISMGQNLMSAFGGTLPRGKVFFGAPKVLMLTEVQTNLASWSISNGKVNIIDIDGYLPSDAVVLTGATGLVGIPQQTQDGVQCQCLLNPLIIVGGRIKIDNKSVNQTIKQDKNTANLAYNQWANPQFLADVARDGFYRAYVVEHEGDTRGQAWYTNITALSIDTSTEKVSVG